MGVDFAAAGVDRPRADLPGPTRLLIDLQRVNRIAQGLTGALSVEAVARCITDGLVDHFGCAFARIWVVESDQSALRLVASSGLYTHTDGAFARVPMGAYKVGKIAQNRMPFLSNRLAEEPWVKDRSWALENGIQGFAGYPLMTGDRVVGVLATFSRSPMAAEFLEVLQVLCMTATIALDAVLRPELSPVGGGLGGRLPQGMALSEHIAALLPTASMALVGTEIPLPAAVGFVFVRLAELLDEFRCAYARLIYGPGDVTLDAIVAVPMAEGGHAVGHSRTLEQWRSRCHSIRFMAACLGGRLEAQPGESQPMLQVVLQVPYAGLQAGPKVSIRCEAALVQVALTCLAFRAGLTVCEPTDAEAVLITDSEAIAATQTRLAQPRLIWVRVNPTAAPPRQAQYTLDWTVDASHLRQIVTQLGLGQPVPASAAAMGAPRPSQREREIMACLAQGLRDREIAARLYISESTVKFHINNSLVKLQAKNRYQAVYQAAIQGWI
jgi:DNA-binding CsgD family transcriptional regulator